MARYLNKEHTLWVYNWYFEPLDYLIGSINNKQIHVAQFGETKEKPKFTQKLEM
jgi:hypothetical protein